MTDHVKMADLQELHRRLFEGVFYEDYDKDVRLMGQLRKHLAACLEAGGEYKIPHPLYFGRPYPIQTVLRDLASQEGCDGDPYDQMVEAATALDAVQAQSELRFKRMEWESERHAEVCVERDDAVREFARAILHGDEQHQAWLVEAADSFVAGEPLPEPRGKGASEVLRAAYPVLREIAHQAYHVAEGSEERVADKEVVMDPQDYYALEKALNATGHGDVHEYLQELDPLMGVDDTH